MKVYALVDWMGAGGLTADEEYVEIENEIKEIVGRPFVYKTEVYPYKLENDPVDIYIIDFGGVLPGAESMVVDVYRQVLKQIEDKPNTLFVLWSTFTQRWYANIIETDFPELTSPPNVICRQDDSAWDTIRMWADTAN